MSARHHVLLYYNKLVNQITMKQGSTVRLTTTKAFDNINRLTGISSMASVANGSYPASSHAYGYNNANQRTSATMRDGGYWSYTYDSLGQVTSAKKRFSDDLWACPVRYNPERGNFLLCLRAAERD